MAQLLTLEEAVVGFDRLMSRDKEGVVVSRISIKGPVVVYSRANAGYVPAMVLLAPRGQEYGGVERKSA